MSLFANISIIVVSLLLLISFCFIWCRKKKIIKLNMDSKLMETDKGKVEYVHTGNGPVVLSLHGGLGGWDQGIVIADDWLELSKNGFSILSPSRPGYLRTPLETGKTPEEAADAMAAILDDLNIKKVLVLGTSGGGPTALQFVLRHPNRTQALVMLSAISKQHLQPKETQKKWYGKILFSKLGALLLDIGWWIIVGMVKYFPRLMIKSMLKTTTTQDFKLREELDYTMTHPKALKGVQRLMQSQFPLSTRKAGLNNDLETNAHMPIFPTEKINCPALVVHGRLDGNVPFSHAQFTSGTIPNAKMYEVKNGGHLICVGSDSDHIRSVIINFFKDNLKE
jgi:pimeloyl-ACP methyl ester carboxylesterase